MNSLGVLICDRRVSCLQANSAVQSVCWPGKQPGEDSPTYLENLPGKPTWKTYLENLTGKPTWKSTFKSNLFLSWGVYPKWVFHQVVQFDWLHLPLMALYFARHPVVTWVDLPGKRAVDVSLIERSILRWTAAVVTSIQDPCQNCLCRSNDVPSGRNPAGSGRRPTFLRLSTRHRRNLSPDASFEKVGLNRILYFAIKD